MSSRLTLMGLGGAAGILLVIIGLELVSPPGPPPLPTSQEPPPAQVPLARPAGPNRGAHVSEEQVEVLLARPLFALSRKPDKPGETTTSDTSSDSGLPRLAGVLVWNGGKAATFQASRDDKPVVVAEGDQVAGYVVKQISLGGVTVAGPDGTETIEPKFDPNATPAEPALPPRQPQPIPPPQPAPPQPANLPRPGNPQGPAFDPRRFQVPVGMVPHRPVPGISGQQNPVPGRPPAGPTGVER